MGRPPGAFVGKLHRYSRYTAFEHTRPDVSKPKHTLIWMGGLGDGPLTVDYPITLAHCLPSDWSLVEATTQATLNGWGTTSLAKDATQLSACVSYFRNVRPAGGKIVLMGHSTGCQDAMEYVTGPNHDTREPLDGAILQASVSDREAILANQPQDEYDSFVETAKKLIGEGRSDDVLPIAISKPLFGPVPISAYRALSLTSPNMDGDDDYFSSDLPDERLAGTFGNFPARTPLMFLFSGNDEHVSKSVDVAKLLQHWGKFVKVGGGIVDEKNGGIVEGATHNLNDNDKAIVDDLCSRVIGFLENITTGNLKSTNSHL
jgi:pimeloyl-ACP methyl ester carboxylesterase